VSGKNGEKEVYGRYAPKIEKAKVDLDISELTAESIEHAWPWMRRTDTTKVWRENSGKDRGTYCARFRFAHRNLHVVERFTKAEFEVLYGRQILEFGADRAVHELPMQTAIRMKLNVSTGDTTEYVDCSDAPPRVIKNV